VDKPSTWLAQLLDVRALGSVLGRSGSERAAAYGRTAGDAYDPKASDAARASTYPPPYPDSWYVLARSEEVGSRPLEVEALGRRFVVFRSDVDGRVAVLDADCPHLGASLGGGTVRDGCIQCPFHQWRFRPDGTVAAVPYRDRVPSSVRTRSWVVEEAYGSVFVYFSSADAERGRAPEPPYRLPRYPEIDDGRFVYRGSYDPRVVRMHLLEFAENSADFRHFAPLHGEMFIPWTSMRVPGITVVHEASWEPDPREPHVAWFRDRAHLEILGREVPRSGADAAIEFVGPGGVVVFTFDVPDFGGAIMFQSHTPLGPMAQQVRFTWFAERRMPRLIASYVIGNWISQWREDVPIWERKVYRRKPMLLPSDGPMHQLRRWYSQFYPDGAVDWAA
jgi:cholesterol 7-dehydrogenase